MPAADPTVHHVDHPAELFLDDGCRASHPAGIQLVDHDDDHAEHRHIGQHDELHHDVDTVVGDAVEHDFVDDDNAFGLDVIFVNDHVFDAAEVKFDLAARTPGAVLRSPFAGPGVKP